MLGTALKELARGLFRYLDFQFARRFSRARQALAQDAGTLGGSPDVGSDQNTASSSGVRQDFQPVRFFEWQRLGEQDGQVYEGGPSLSALGLIIREPRFILDVGCSSGDFALNVKKQYPRAKIWGVEPNERAARIAATRIDRVLPHRIEEIDWSSEGVRREDIDTVFLFDVLEHMYNPWQALLTIRNLVCSDAQIIVSIPNVRNILLLQDLISGYWRYRPGGLLDITHIRFFTQQDMLRMFYQTGFRVIKSMSTHCPSSAAIFGKHRDGPFPQTIQLASATITAHSLEDLSGFCAVQHMYCLQPADYRKLSPQERDWIDAPHPPTLAFSLD